MSVNTRASHGDGTGPVAPVAARPGQAEPVQWRPVLGIVAVLIAVQLAFSHRYGYFADELYFRLLGEKGPAWGYVDQPPLLPLLIRVSTAVFGDTLPGMRVVAVVCAALTVVLGVMLAAEFGGRRWAQVCTAAGLASSMWILGIGHFLLTSSVDNVTWAAALLCTVRALLRAEPRWWIPAGAVLGLGLYAKLMIGLLLVTVLIGLLAAGPRRVFRQRDFLLGGLIALVVGAPNLIYQLTHGLPQVQMARAMGEAGGSTNRDFYLPSLIILFGPVMMVLVVSAMVGLFRDPAWRPVRALGVAFPLAIVATYLTDGGRADYVAGYLVVLLAAGAVRGERWAARRRWRTPVTAGVATLLGLPVALLFVPVLPVDSLAGYPVNELTLSTVGWPALVSRTTDVYRALPAADRDRVVVLTQNVAQAGALDRYGRDDLPPVYSGQNELYEWGPPAEDRDVVIALGVDEDRLRTDFASCSLAATIDNGYGIENPEQGGHVTVCRGPRAKWSELWPDYRHLGAYF
ncbi:glycosyltransferase family 39 protein [Winogradskya humida]|uniref:Glycosyltransferase RgtA/B/C/D-like domain-containing protein n=1 Tax=Winogradskya humida TaxID=113566 RepID=A0ABQ4A4S4_9ACTN|nr:glycosyltransferase family 39 protein [Actinoplanes humidus]GIE25856.1 hypothetical protein Ahu01nite_089580 [Actinoplanes humidus]